MERCPVDGLPESVLSRWDVEFLCGLHGYPGCELTPDHPLIVGTAEPEGAPGPNGALGKAAAPRRTRKYRFRGRRAGRASRPARRRQHVRTRVENRQRFLSTFT